ncbi:hypothetical protein HDU96_004289 [Phlyctochytrium bullatum]|nr:hypothetical protein HDU96_004289 [Phlyctochytrium bullatum]
MVVEMQKLSNPKSVCLIVEQFGYLGQSKEGHGHSNAELAVSMARRGYDVTVLFVGDENSQFNQLAQKFLEKNVRVIRLPHVGVSLGSRVQSVESISYEVYQYLRSSSPFGHVIFSATSGAGYYTLQAQKQGLYCSETKFTVLADEPTLGAKERIESGDIDYHPVKAETLKSDYLYQRSIELADNVVVSSSLLLDEFFKGDEWKLELSKVRVINSLPPQWKLPERYPSAQNSIKEIVYVGPFTFAGGLKAFCDSLDQIATHLAASGVKVTFLGFSSTVLEMSSEEYIELRALTWEASGLQWTVREADSLKSILNYMLAGDLDKLAVIPSEFDAYAGLPQMLYFSGVPFIGSSTSAIKDIIEIADHSRMISNPDGVELSAKITKVLNGASAITKPRGEPKAQIRKWIDLLEEPSQKVCESRYDELDEKPLVSVVIVHHNRAKFLQQSIESLYAQTYKNIEVVLVDDGSTDAASIKYLGELSWKWWEEKGWKILREQNKYLGAARNTGARNAAGKYVLFLDDDDFSKPHHIETLVRVAVNTGADIVTSGHDTFSGLRKPTQSKPSERFIPIGKAKLVGMLENVFGDSAMMMKRERFFTFGGYTEDYGVGFEDYEFYAKASMTNITLEAVAEPLHWYRRHSTSMSKNTNLKTNQLRMLRPYLAARGLSSAQERAVMDYTQTLFFEKFAISSAEERAIFREAQSNITIPSPTPKPPPVKISCDAYLDQTGTSAYTFNTVKVWNNKSSLWCWDFAGRNIIASLPCQPGYSDAFAIIDAFVPATTPFDFFKDYTDLFLGSTLNSFYQRDGFFNFPVVPPGSRLVNRSPKSDLAQPQIIQGWFERKPIYYVNLGQIPNLPISAGSALTSAAIDVLKAGQPFGSPVLEYGQDKSTGFYAAKFIDVTSLSSYKEDDFKSIDQLGTPYQPYSQSRIWNCPIVYTEPLAKAAAEELKLDGIEPSVVPNLPSVKVTLHGSGFSESNTVYVNQVAVPSSNVTVVSSEEIKIDIDVSAFPGTNGLVTVYIDDSISYDLYYYNSKAQVTSVQTSSLYIETADQVIGITGEYLVDYPSAVCVFNTTEEGEMTPLTVQNSTYATCPLPQVDDATVFSVNVLFSKPKFGAAESSDSDESSTRESFYIPLGPNSTNTFVVSAPAPKIVYAQFLESGGAIYVELDQPADVIDSKQFTDSKVVVYRNVDEPFPCGWIFETNPKGGNVVPGKLARNGSETDCLVTVLSPYELLLELSSDFTSSDPDAVAPLRRLFVKGGSLWYQGAEFSETAPSFTTVQPPEEVDAPDVEINAPLFVAACSDIELDLSESSGNLGRLFRSGEISYSTTTPLPSDLDRLLNSTLVAGLSKVLSGESTVITVPSSALWAPTGSDFLTYAFTVKLINFMGRAGTTTVLVNRMNDNSAPYVVVDQPSGKPSAGEPITVTVGTNPICNIRDPVSYRWTVQNCPGLSIPSSFTSSILYIPPFTLPPSTKCDIRVEAKYSKDANWRAYPTSFTTKVDELTVSAGPSRTARNDQDLTISAEINSDSYTALPNNLECRWTCISGGGVCSSSISSRLNACTDNVIPKGALSPGAYNFTVSVRNPTTGARAASRVGSIVTVVSRQALSIIIKPSEVYPAANSPSFFLDAVVDYSTVSSPSSLVYKWGNCASSNLKFTRVNFNQTSNFATDVRSRDLRTLKFAEDALRPAGRYCVSVAVTDGATNGYSEFYFATRAAPSSGVCQTSTRGGSFSYNCLGFTTDPASFPLYYTFFIRRASDQPWNLLQPRSTNPSADLRLLTGKNFEVKAEISDAAGSVGNWDRIEKIAGGSNLQRRQSCSTPSCIITDAIANYQQTKNVISAERALGIATLSIKPTDPAFASALSLISAIANDVTVDTKVHGPFLLNSLAAIVGNGYNVQKSDWNAVVNLAKQLIVAAKTSGKAELPVNCVPASSVSQVFAIADQILGNSAVSLQADADRKDILSKIYGLQGEAETCVARRKAVQEAPFTFTATYLGRRVGVAYTDLDNSLCGTTINANQLETSGKTAIIGCGNLDLKLFPNNSAVVDSNPRVNDVSFWDARQETSVNLRSQGFLITAVQIDSTFDSKYKLSTYVVPDPDNANAIDYSKNKYPDQSYRPLCSAFDQKSLDWKTDVCAPQRISNGTVFCKCKQAASFALSVNPIPAPDGQSRASSTSNIGAIVGGVIGGLLFIVAVVGLVFYLRKRKSQQETPLPTTTQNAVTPATVGKALSKKDSIKNTAHITSQNSDTTPGRTAENLEIVVQRSAPVEQPARPRVLPQYIRPPSYEEHMSRRSRSRK